MKVGFFWAKLVYSGTNCSNRADWLYTSKSGFICAECLYSVKVVVCEQSGCIGYWVKSGCILGKWL